MLNKYEENNFINNTELSYKSGNDNNSSEKEDDKYEEKSVNNNNIENLSLNKSNSNLKEYNNINLSKDVTLHTEK